MIKEGDLLWTPTPDRAEASQLLAFIEWLRRVRGLCFANYHDLWQWSVSDLEGFWSALWEHFQIISDSPYQTVKSGNEMTMTRWFDGSRVNYAEHILRHEAEATPDEVAIYHRSEVRPPRTMSWRELADQVRAVATKLRELGIQPGDRVISYMPNVVETVVAMLGAVSVGAVWSAASPEFGEITVVDRFGQIAPKLIFAADGYHFGGKPYDRRNELKAILAKLPTVKSVVWLKYLGLEPLATPQLQSMLWEDLVAQPGPAREQFKFERVPNDHPLWVLYSSGTTGLPKAITHSHVGIILDQLKQMRLQYDLKPGKRMFFFTTTGWMMWNAVLSALFAGASSVLYDGSPVWPKVDCLWDIAESCGTTAFGASPTLVQMMEKADVRPKNTRDLSQLDMIILGGAPSTPATFEWFYENVKTDLWVVNTSGGTDLCGGLVGPAPTLPVHAAEFQARMLGIAVEAFDEQGGSLVDQVGELVVTQPFPSMPLYFWGDKDNRRYRETYFETYPGVWRHGDFIKINKRGGCFIYGRSDATLNRYGVRIGTSEIYRVIDDLKRVVDSIIVCCETGNGGYLVPLFVQLAEGDSLDEGLTEQIKRELREKNSPRHVPDLILQVPRVPYTLTGKKMEVPLRRILMGRKLTDVANPDAMADPAALDWYVTFAQNRDIRARFQPTLSNGPLKA